jgi:hypothetical protein
VYMKRSELTTEAPVITGRSGGIAVYRHVVSTGKLQRVYI